MRVFHPDLAATLLGLAAMLALGCGDSSGPTTVGPNPGRDAGIGTIRVTTLTLGSGVDPDGYSVDVTGLPRQALPASGTVDIAGVPAGDRTVALGGVAGNCLVSEPNPRRVNLAAGGTLEVVFTVRCQEAATVQVTTTTTGINRTTDGYNLYLDPESGSNGLNVRLPANGTVSASPTPGNYLLTLYGLESNCDVALPSPRQITLAVGSPARITLDINCEAPKQLAFVKGEGTGAEIYVINSNRTGEKRITSNLVPDTDPAWSPDGKRIVFASLREANHDIYVMDSDGGNEVRLTTVSAGDHRPAWSPDGRRIAFVSARDGNAEIYVMNADGTNPLRLTSDSGADWDPAWSPDGSKIAFRSERDRSNGIWVMNADGSGAARITTNSLAGGDAGPAWSPDGARIAFVSQVHADRARDLVIVKADGSARMRLTEGYFGLAKPAWSPNGRKIAVGDDDFYYGPSLLVFSPDGISTVGYVAPGYHGTWRP